jgi:hypothetical protein
MPSDNGLNLEKICAFHRVTCLVVAAALLVSCTSRYRLELFLTTESVTKKVKVEQTEYVPGSVLNDPYAREKLIRGDGSALVVATGTRLRPAADRRVFMFGFDEYLRCRIYIQLHQDLAAGAIELKDNSFVQVLGRYDLPTEAKIFLPDSGRIVVDSVTSRHLFVTIHAKYENREQVPLAFDGRFKARL